jgi:hypothetical protein
MMRLPAILRLPADPNHRAARILQIQAGTIGTMLVAAGGSAALLQPALAAAALMFPFLTIFIGGITVANKTDDVTPYIPPEDRVVSRRLFRTLALACSSGMTSSMRREAQQDIVSLVRILEGLLGKKPWIIVERSRDPDDKHPDHLLLRGEDLARVEVFHRRLEAPKGCNRAELMRRCGSLIPLVVLVARDFGLDVTGLVPPISRVPGQRLDTPVPVATLAAPVHRLADEWTAFDRSQIDDVLRNAADAAAGPELDDLERRWLAARTDADPADVDALDQTFLRGAAGLSATIADAIAARARSSRDALTTMTRFIETKHAA